MFQKARESSYLESTSLLVTVIKWRKPLIIVVLSAAVLSYIFSAPVFIRPKYKSTVTFFPASATSISRMVLENNTSEKQDLLAFGEEEQAEQLLQILNSDEIRNTVAAKYKLLEHYNIDPSSMYPQTKLIDTYEENVTFRRTEFMSVEIEVMDTDPKMAADMANDIASLLDSTKNRLQRERATEALQIVERECNDRQAMIKIKEDSLNWLHSLGVMDFRQQSGIWDKEYAKSYSSFNNETASLDVLQKYKSENDSVVVNTKAKVKGAESRMKNVQTKLDLLAKYGGVDVSLNEDLTTQREELSRLRQRYNKLKVDAEQSLSHKFIINKAVKAENKSYPIRWLIMTVSVFCSFILAFVVLLIIERIKEFQYRL